MASTVVATWFRAVTTNRCPKRPLVSKVIPSGLSLAGRLVNRYARPSGVIAMMPGLGPGWRAKIMPLGNEQPAPATRPLPAIAI
jgi:hypothetical protein